MITLASSRKGNQSSSKLSEKELYMIRKYL